MIHDIREYSDNFIEAQEKLGKEIWEKYSYGFYSTIEQLKTAYSKDDFDPQLKLYAFNGNELIGFITAKIIKKDDEEVIADMAFPHTKENNIEIADALYSKLLENLKWKGVTKIQARGGKGRRNTLDLVKKFGYSYSHDQALIRWIDSTKYNIPMTDFSSVELLKEDDIRETAVLYSEFYNYPIEEAVQDLKAFYDISEEISIGPVIVKVNNEIVAATFARQRSQRDNKTDTYRAGPIMCKNGHDEKRELLMYYLLSELQKRKNKHFVVGFVGDIMEKVSDYDFLGEFLPISFYTLTLK